MLRYTVLRLLIFLGCISALWLLGLRDEGEVVLLVVGAALLSAVISFVVLRRFREDYSAQLSARIEKRLEAKQASGGGTSTDEDAEDEESARGDDTFR